MIWSTSESDEWKTAFNTLVGYFAPAVCQALANIMFRYLQLLFSFSFFFVYLYNILIFSNHFLNTRNIQKILLRLLEKGFYVKAPWFLH